jgi:hypothetical protein
MVTVTYRGDRGRQYPPDRFPLDLGLYGDLDFELQRTTKDLHQELYRIADTLQRWSASGGGGLLALSPEDVRERLTVRGRPQSPAPATPSTPAKVGPMGRLLKVVGRLRRRH